MNLVTGEKTQTMDQSIAELGSSRLSARKRRAMSAIARPTEVIARPFSSSRARRPYSAYTKRGDDEEAPKYDTKESDREEWWRHSMKETPVPGSYRLGHFLEEVERRPNSYRFRDCNRAKSASHMRFMRTGESLLPGIYESKGFVDDNMKKPSTFGFKGIEREDGAKIGHGYFDKDVDTSPTWYNVVDYNEGAGKKDHKQCVFQSKTKRTSGFVLPEKVPGPGQYEMTATRKPVAVSSSFKSAVPRLDARISRTPGPGTYSYQDSVFGQPKRLPSAIHHMKKKHGISI